MGLHDGHRARKKQQFLEHGLAGMPDHEVLELLLYYAIPRRDTNETAHRLIQRFGSLRSVLDADVDELTRVEGVGENAATLLRLFAALERRLSAPALPDRPIRSGEQVGSFFVALMDREVREVLYLMCLDGKGKLLSCRLVATGGVNVTAVSVRQVVEEALRAGASAVILSHNHPSGVALPSRADELLTRQVAETLRPLGVHLLDHIIVADGDYVSMAQSGYIPR